MYARAGDKQEAREGMMGMSIEREQGSLSSSPLSLIIKSISPKKWCEWLGSRQISLCGYTVVIKQFSSSATVIGISYMCTYIILHVVFFLCSIHPYKRKTHLECNKTLLYSSSMWGTSLINLQIHSDVVLINIPPLRASSLGWMLL